MKAADLDILLQEGEGVMIEYKKRVSASLTREITAFANTAGGRILLGVWAQAHDGVHDQAYDKALTAHTTHKYPTSWRASYDRDIVSALLR